MDERQDRTGQDRTLTCQDRSRIDTTVLTTVDSTASSSV
eukprot:COSAG06_NODE_31648_length_518_cov_0.618138_1_plen_38_part_10